jgi:phosphopantetheinyl transferase
MRELEQTQDALLEALAAPGPLTAAPVRELVEQRTFSVESDPFLLDHCLFFQPPGWPHPEDRYPVVPIAMSMELMLELASRAAGRRASALEDVHAATWLAVTPPADVTMRVTPREDGGAGVAFEGFVDGVARFDEPGPPEPDTTPLRKERREIWEHDDMYGARWLFHGPAYQGVVRIHTVADDGMRATLRVLDAPGGLIDAAGQVLGMWAFRTATVDWLALPYRVDRLETWEPLPPPGTLVECVVRIRESGPRLVKGDIEVVWDGRLCLRITGWQDVRFESDHRMWSVMIYPEHCLLAEPQPDGYVVVPHVRRAPWSEEYLARRYLSAPERAELERAPAGRRLRKLYGRVAAKDAVRQLLDSLGHDAVYPVEVRVESAPDGRPLVSGPFEEDVRVSLAHTDDMSVALAAIGADPGIDAERVEPRDDGFLRMAFGEAELGLLPKAGERDEWLTRLWCAKEAVGKARGTGLAGDPRSIAADEVAGERIRFGDRWVETRRRGDHTIAWI